MPREQALYVLVRNDLSNSSKAVQAGHAVAKFLLENSTTWKNGTLVYLKVPNKDALESIIEEKSDIPISKFREPDLGNELTAIALLGPEDTSKSVFPYLKLL